jgi:hypothetical protein
MIVMANWGRSATDLETLLADLNGNVSLREYTFAANQFRSALVTRVPDTGLAQRTAVRVCSKRAQ